VTAATPDDGEAGAGRTSLYRHEVRYLECDQQGVVYNMWYLGYFDEAFAGFLAGGGRPYPDLIASGVDVQVVHADIDWTGPLRWGDEAVIEVRLGRRGTTSFALDYTLRSGAGAGVATARIVYVTVATDGSGKVPVPPDLGGALG
jgi:acyl-CoA thioester hydrolase